MKIFYLFFLKLFSLNWSPRDARECVDQLVCLCVQYTAAQVPA